MKRKIEALRPIALLAGALVLVVGILCVLWNFVFKDVFATVEDCLARGSYQAAYNKAKTDEEKEAVLMENKIALACAECIDLLIDPTVFELREAAYYEERSILLGVAAKNSGGNTVVNHWLFSYEKDEKAFCFKYVYDSIFEEVPDYSWYSAEESYEVAVKNAASASARLDLSLGYYDLLSEEGVANINNLFAQGQLDDVKPIELPEESDDAEPTTTSSAE